ncbi:AmpD protein [Chromohalobacter marismortui]|uniref:1,6-anhydro-N-acetylmuramyl-L-alanine amidase AmpD n=1 Tax=Chromohalobacter marismortui TaxID=42055 RepID=A0A4R7NSE6_9GAMM|nr:MULTISPECIES: 1,6-anhydro-N-acetylmuramyl-L-alanine amidase AmpD [Chromohalobacter]MCI0509339.1 1,6-anhydro-N-acetylmuramyl-L-alanine amidase AmpD [Chromohalobacter sp.]MCI0592344.1 1,6-anhydro-N-acetylmuramyl-L-alanine amidase AmpD [Chromohalobacter sp.]TDU23768.1 AmpD protein [Chromohalobacter marismortui]
MRVDNHWLASARHLESPNHNRRPEGEVSALVLHSISLPPGRFGGDAIERLFTNCLDPAAHPYFATLHSLRVSAHVLIRRDGDIVQFVGFDKRAWHAGRSRWWDGQRERRELNDFSIGIELEGDEVHAYRDAQYRCLARVFMALREHYPALSLERVTSHAHVAPLRKTDPGPAFDWAYFRRCLDALPYATS